MLFDFQAFIEELREKPDKKQIVEKYEKRVWPIKGGVKDQIWYTEYLVNFQSHPYKMPNELKNDFDWNLLQQLVIGSFSSDYELKKIENEELRDLYIAVKSGEQSVVKTVSELRSFQILRLYEIYVEEQMNLHALKYEDDKEKNAINWEWVMRKKIWKAVMDTLGIEEESKIAKVEQEEKLSSLYDQL